MYVGQTGEWSSQYGLTKEKSLANLIALNNEMTDIANKRRAADIAFLDFIRPVWTEIPL